MQSSYMYIYIYKYPSPSVKIYPVVPPLHPPLTPKAQVLPARLGLRRRPGSVAPAGPMRSPAAP